MEAGEEVVGAEVGEEHGEDGREEVDVEHSRAAEDGESAAPAMYGEGVGELHDDCAGHFRIRPSVAAPGLVGPHSTDEDAGSEQTDGGGEHESVEHGKTLSSFA